MTHSHDAAVPNSASHCVPFLRRHARMLLGRQDGADAAVARALSSLSDAHAAGEPSGDLRTRMFRALYQALEPELKAREAEALRHDRRSQADARLGALSRLHRSTLLLTSVEGLTVRAVAAVLGRTVEEIEDLADEAQLMLERELETSVLIIEDEWAIARDLKRIVSELGHNVAGVAATRDDAVAAARRSRPGLVLADINLADGSSGIDAVRDIFEDQIAPTIFITAFPERLLTGRRPEPTYLISKPYSPAMIQATVSQALFFSDQGVGRA